MNSKTTQAIAEALTKAQAAQKAQNTNAQRDDAHTAQAAQDTAEPEPQAVKICYEGRELYNHEIYRAAIESLVAVGSVMSERSIMDNDDGTFTVTLRHLMQMCIEAAVNVMSALPAPEPDQAEAMVDQVRSVRQSLAPFGFAWFDHRADSREDGAYVITYPGDGSLPSRRNDTRK